MDKKSIFKFNRNIFLLGMVSLLNDIGGEMIMPILPMFIVSLGGTGLIIGLIGGFRESISSIIKVLSGYWSDKTGKRKVFVFVGYTLASFFKLFLAFSRCWSNVLFFSCFERIGKGIRTAPRDAIVADAMPQSRGRGFGLHRTFDTIGAVTGSSIVLMLFWFFGFDFKSIIIIAAIITFVALVPLFFVREHQRLPQDLTFKIGLKNLPKSVKSFTFISSLFALANFSYMFFILKAQVHFAGKGSIGIPILLYVLFNIFYAIFSIPSGLLSDKIGRKKVLILGYILFSFISLSFAFAQSGLFFVLLFALYGIVYAILEVNQRAYVADLATPELKATALGTFHTAIGLIALPSSLIAGLLWQVFNPMVTFVYGSVLSLLAVILFAGNLTDGE